MRRRFTLAAAALAAVALVLQAPVADTRNVALYFDENAENCVGEIENFGQRVKVWAFAYADPGDTLNGAILRLELAEGFRIFNQELPRMEGGQNDMEGDLKEPNGLDITLSPCIVTDGSPTLLLTFEIDQWDARLPSGPQVHDFELKLRGGTVVADSLTLVEPHLKLCAADPIEGEGELVRATSQAATFNCTSECPCTVGVKQTTWAEFKLLYLEP